MIIVCPSCGKNFDVDEKLIPDKGRLLKCGSCNQTWFFNKNVSEQTEPLIDKPAKQKKILYKDENINKSVSKKPIKPGSELVKYKPKYNFTFGKFLSYIIVSIITFVAIIIVLDTFKDPLSNIFPNLELVLYNLFETLRDLILFAKDLN
ncbi:zinc-ribbon domain-containing protein [Candidatus Pelagibacter sp.]|uniref:zinc-ribbon domain-containing protein n=1 Tax=Candidatus Pelagibacter sp. TaxID=2024849 RepID=UPI003F840347